jgi:excisionase family DNA binding protein
MPKLTLQEMADELGFCSKTFRKYVTKYKIPHVKLGRDTRFDSNEVWEFLRGLAIAEPTQKIQLKPDKLPRRSKRRPASTRYSQMLGLGGDQ